MVVVHVWWPACCGLELEEALLAACLPVHVHVRWLLHGWLVWLPWLELEVSSAEVVHVCWPVCCGLELEDALLTAGLPMAVHVLKLHWWQVWLLWLELEASSVEVVHVCWPVCCGLGLEESLLAACLPVHAHVRWLLHWWLVWLPWLELEA